MISLRARFVRLITRHLFKKFGGDPDIPRLRETWENLAARSRPAAGTRMRYVDMADVECDWLVPSGCQDAPVLLYLHGGAYVSGSSKTHRSMVSHIATEAGMRAVLPNYRLAPGNPFPAGLNDCVKVYLELINDGVDPRQYRDRRRLRRRRYDDGRPLVAARCRCAVAENRGADFALARSDRPR